jgi:hypothetical protein
MPRSLIVVEDRFFIERRGLVLFPGIVPRAEERVRTGDPIVLKMPDGSRLDWAIGGIVRMQCSSSRPKDEIFILVRGLNKDDLPVGTEVWSAAAKPRWHRNRRGRTPTRRG